MKPIFNLENLTPLQKGRVEKSLNTKYRYDEGIMTQKQYIEKYAVDKKIYQGGIFNRKHFNSLDFEGQKKYEASLKKKVEYEIVLENNCSVQIPKIIYKVLYFEEECVECGKSMNDMEHNYGTDEMFVCIHCYNDAQVIG